MDPYAWSWDPDALILFPAMTVGYLLVVRRYGAPAWRIACFLAAMVLLLGVLITPIDTIALHYLLSIHLLQNVVLAEWAPALAVLGIPPVLAGLAPRVPLLAALGLWVANYALWHLPWLYDAALRHQYTLLHLEHALYFGTGVLFWWPVVHGSHQPGVKAAYLFAAFVLSSPIGLVLALVPEPIYDFYADGPGLWGLSPITDQEIAGVTMAVEQSIVFFAAFAYFFARFFAEQDAA